MLVKALISLPATLAAIVLLHSAAVAAGPSAAPKTPSGKVSNRRIGCDEVMREVDSDKSVRHGHTVSITAVARVLGTRPWWVERCMTAYGRHISQRADEHSGESLTEERLERFEEEEPEELAPEEIEDAGEKQEPEEKPIKTPRPTPKGAE